MTQTLYSLLLAQAAPAGDDIRDVRTVALEPPFNWTLWGGIAAAVGVLLIVLVVYLVMRGRKAPLLPHERALLSLEEARNEAKPGEGREYAYAVSEVVRQYIEERFNAQAAHRTTEEFLYSLLQNPNAALAGYTDSLKQFMEGCDLVKFAGVQLDQQGIDQFHITALNFIRATAPRKQGEAAPEMEEVPPAVPSEPVAPAAEAPAGMPPVPDETAVPPDTAEPEGEHSLEEEPAPQPAAEKTGDDDESDDSRYLPK